MRKHLVALSCSLLLAACATPPKAPRYEIVGYYPGWKGEIEIDASLLTVVNYAFLDVGPDGALVLTNPKVDEAHFARLAVLRDKNPHLRIVASVGGWTRSNGFSNMAAGAASRAHFIRTTVGFLRKYRFDGIDIDWEYPVAIGIPCTGDHVCQRAEDKANFVILARE